MRIFTELELREQYHKCPFETFSLPDNSKLTPAAEQFLKDKRIKVITRENKALSPAPQTEVQKEYLLPNGKVSKEKPEHMTQLRGCNLVDKCHPVIHLRGKLDSLQAQIIDAIIDFKAMGLEQMAGQLEEILGHARAIMRGEVTGEKLTEPSFAGMDSKTIREYSHHPDKYIGVKHFLPDPAHGRPMSRLNILRTAVRETELAAARAFCKEDGSTSRTDIMQMLNRMSSMIYIMMCRLLAGKLS